MNIVIAAILICKTYNVLFCCWLQPFSYISLLPRLNFENGPL